MDTLWILSQLFSRRHTMNIFKLVVCTSRMVFTRHSSWWEPWGSCRRPSGRAWRSCTGQPIRTESCTVVVRTSAKRLRWNYRTVVHTPRTAFGSVVIWWEVWGPWRRPYTSNPITIQLYSYCAYLCGTIARKLIGKRSDLLLCAPNGKPWEMYSQRYIRFKYAAYSIVTYERYKPEYNIPRFLQSGLRHFLGWFMWALCIVG